jgi:hypothetical protein
MLPIVTREIVLVQIFIEELKRLCQGMPLRRTQTMPVRHARSETSGRPPCGRRGGIAKKGSTRSHNGSGSSAAAIPVHDFADEDQGSEVLLRALKKGGLLSTQAPFDLTIVGNFIVCDWFFLDRDSRSSGEMRPHALAHRERLTRRATLFVTLHLFLPFRPRLA